MIQLVHNGRESSLDDGAFATVGDLIGACARQAGSETVLMRLCLDGREIPDEEWERARSLAIDEIGSVEIDDGPLDQVVRRSLRGVLEYAPRVSRSLGQVVDRLRRGQIASACSLYATSLDALSVVLFTLSASARRFVPGSDTLADVDGAFAPWLDALADCHEREDWVSVADLLEFELLPVLSGWIGRFEELERRLEAEGATR